MSTKPYAPSIKPSSTMAISAACCSSARTPLRAPRQVGIPRRQGRSRGGIRGRLLREVRRSRLTISLQRVAGLRSPSRRRSGWPISSWRDGEGGEGAPSEEHEDFAWSRRPSCPGWTCPSIQGRRSVVRRGHDARDSEIDAVTAGSRVIRGSSQHKEESECLTRS